MSNSTFVRVHGNRIIFRGVHLRDVVFEDIFAASEFTFAGCLLEHVTIRGRVRGVTWFRSWGGAFGLPRQLNQRYDEIDWALDITGAEFSELSDKGGIPHDKIRHDPKHQVVVDAARVDRDVWESVDCTDAPYLTWVIANPYPNDGHKRLIVAPSSRRHPRDKWIAVVDQLRELGQVE